MSFPFLFGLGIAPSVIWLLFFLRKDSHPESNRMIIKIFFYGAITAILAALAELGVGYELFGEEFFGPKSLLILAISNIAIVAFAEEIVKYSVVKRCVLSNKEFDEPIDAMLYMIISALGFAALENTLVMFTADGLKSTLSLAVLRFLTATFLHALASGTVGYYLALSIYETKKRYRLLATGLFIAVILHGFYNIAIIKLGESVKETSAGKTLIENPISFAAYSVLIIAVLTGLAYFVLRGFRRLKTMPSICK